jgi:large subunit ribosomal protein L4
MHLYIYTLNWASLKLSLFKRIILNFKFNKVVKNHLIAENMHWQRTVSRLYTSKALTKGEVSGTGKKPFPQKGRGMARQGSYKNPHQRGGGIAFPPRYRFFRYKINKQKRKIALQSIFLNRINESRIKVVDSLVMPKPETRKILHLLKSIKFRKTLFIDSKNLYLQLSIRNLSSTKLLSFSGVNTLDFIKYPNIVVTQNVLYKIIILLKCSDTFTVDKI